ncbi:hypothetical protein [Bizionia arctica]|uniref:hypothetical protein n=1 Tax=Bizionia arctica TaxID=1495645 RepID=UPI001667F219|nr:hypothetical protein [Bizionia arctica]
MDKRFLAIVMPIMLATLGLKHYLVCKKQSKAINYYFLIALLFIATSDVLGFLWFKETYSTVVGLTSAHLLLFSWILKPYIQTWKFKSVVSLSIVICILLFGYIIYAVLELLIDFIPKDQMLITFVCVFCLLVYMSMIALIYINDFYNNGVILLISGFLNFFQISLTPINELFHYNITFTVLIILCHGLSIYLFMNFISNTHPVDARDISEKYIKL